MIKKITQISLGWKEALSIALLHRHIAPKEQIGLSPYEILYGRPFVNVNDLFLDSEAQTLWSYAMAFGEFQQDWQMDFIQMPVPQRYKYLLVMIDTFTGWIEGFPTWTEKAEEVVKKKKKLLYEIIPIFGLPRSL